MTMETSHLDDPLLVQRACEMKHTGMFVSDIAKQLSRESGKRITQLALWRLFNSLKEKTVRKPEEYEYPSFEDIAYLFSKKFQKEKNKTVITYRNTTIRRDLMIRILNYYCNAEFMYYIVKNKCNDRDGDGNFRAHWNYLLDNNFIEKVSDRKFKVEGQFEGQYDDEYKFKFCERVKKWKNVGQV